MEEVKKEKGDMTSPAAFVEGGIQEACDDACSICLEAFCDSDPSTVTSCKHEFHLQCVLEWCQRSSNCPMCWRPISLKDPTSQELLEGVERERSIRLTPSRNMALFPHPTLLPVGVDDPELEEQIMQHLAAAAAMGRTHHRITRREGSWTRSSPASARPQLIVLSTNPNGSITGPNSSSSLGHTEVESETHALRTNSSIPAAIIGIEDQQNLSPPFVQHNIISGSASGSRVAPNAHQGASVDNRSNTMNQDRVGPSEFQSPSDNWKSRLNSLSMKYKESISRNTRGWKEKLFSRSSSMAEIGSEVKRELNAGIATVSRMMERLETRENRTSAHASSLTSERIVDVNEETSREATLDGNRRSANSAPSSVSSLSALC